MFPYLITYRPSQHWSSAGSRDFNEMAEMNRDQEARLSHTWRLAGLTKEDNKIPDRNRGSSRSHLGTGNRIIGLN